MSEVVAIGLDGREITVADIDLAERMHYWGRGHHCAWDECDADACFADLVRLGIATEADR